MLSYFINAIRRTRGYLFQNDAWLSQIHFQDVEEMRASNAVSYEAIRLWCGGQRSRDRRLSRMIVFLFQGSTAC